jgi:hypothetical protein
MQQKVFFDGQPQAGTSWNLENRPVQFLPRWAIACKPPLIPT